MVTQTRKASPARTEIFTVCPPGPGALLAEGERVGVSTAPPPSRSMKTLKKQRLEVLSAYCYLLTFLFTGEWCPGSTGGGGKGEGGGRKAGAPPARMSEGQGRGEGPEVQLGDGQ